MKRYFLLASAAILLFGIPPARADLKVGGVTVTVNNPNQVLFDALTGNGGDAVSVEIYNLMATGVAGAGTAELFNFTDQYTAKQHFRARKASAAAMKSMAQPMGGIDFGQSGAVASYPDGWITMDPRGKIATVAFQKKSGVQMSQAVANLETGRTRADCITGANSAILIGLQQYGPDWLNAKVSASGELIVDNKNPIAWTVTAAQDTNVRIPGDWLYMRNDESYKKGAQNKGNNDPNWAGECCICTPGGNYSGIGGAYEKSEQQLKDLLIEMYFRDTGGQLPEEKIPNVKFTRHFRIKILAP
jgi:hypothetical protein